MASGISQQSQFIKINTENSHDSFNTGNVVLILEDLGRKKQHLCYIGRSFLLRLKVFVKLGLLSECYFFARV